MSRASVLTKKYYDPYSETMDYDFFPSLTRLSVAANEDDFDYALELVHDVEYRLVAKTISKIVGFDEYEIAEDDKDDIFARQEPFESAKTEALKSDDVSNLHDHRVNVIESNDGSFKSDESQSSKNGISSIDPINRGDNANRDSVNSKESIESKDTCISYQEFIWRMGMMQKQKTWIESVRRRSSLNFQNAFLIPPTEARKKFLLLLNSGVHVRRHQKNHYAEYVRLSSSDRCQTIEWSNARPLELQQQRKQQGQENGTTEAIFATSTDRSGLDCCITVCGCGDDLLTGNDSPVPKNKDNSDRRHTFIASNDEDKFLGYGRLFYNYGYKHKGLFEDTDIVKIHPATMIDPTDPENQGTDTFRSSKQGYNPSLSFSIIYRRIFSSQGYETFDIECDNQDTYIVLIRGFYLLREEAKERRRKLLSARQQELTEASFKTRVYECISSLCHLFEKSYEEPDDPISNLFSAKDNSDLFSIFSIPNCKSDVQQFYPNLPDWQDQGKVPDNQPQLPPAQFLGWQTAGTQIWARLAMAGLDVKPVYSWDLTRIILKIKCPQWRLEEVAELMHLRLKNRDGTMRRFKVSRRETFVPMGGDGNIFRSSERQQIIDYIIRSKIKDGGAELDESSSLGRKIIQRFPLHMESRLQDLRHKWIKFWKIEPPGHVSMPWSILTTPFLETCRKTIKTVVTVWNGLLRQPLDHVAEYFGEDIAFYFAFLAFYTRWLVFPSVLGFIIFCYQIHDQKLDHWLCLPYAIAVMVWACFLLAYWRQKSSVFAYRWGVLDYEVEEAERPQFQGKYEYDDSSGDVRKTYPQWKRCLKYSITIPILSIVSLAMLVIMATVFSTQDQLYYNYAHRQPLDYHPRFNIFIGVSQLSLQDSINNAKASNSTLLEQQMQELRDPWGQHISTSDLGDPDFWTVTFLYPCLYGIIVDIMAYLFSWGALMLNDYENHRTSTIYTNRLILKIFSFQFITVFTSLYYYAFISKRGEASYLRMSVTIFSLMTVGQWYSTLMDLFLPSIYRRIIQYHRKMSISKINRRVYGAREYLDIVMGWIGIHSRSKQNSSPIEMQPSNLQQQKALDQVNKRANLLEQARSRVWEEALLARYSTFGDYTNLVLQLGFVLLFSIVFPLAPLLLLLNNLVLIRLHAVKVCYLRQRPIATKISGLGVWEDLMQVMSAAGILTNCGIMAFTSSVLTEGPIGHHLGQGPLLLLLFAFEHLILFFKYWLHVSIPKIPPSVLRAKNRDRHSHVHSRLANDMSTNKDKKKSKRMDRYSLQANVHESFDRDRDGAHKDAVAALNDPITSYDDESKGEGHIATTVPFQTNRSIASHDVHSKSFKEPTSALFDINIFEEEGNMDDDQEEDTRSYHSDNRWHYPMNNSPSHRNQCSILDTNLSTRTDQSIHMSYDTIEQPQDSQTVSDMNIPSESVDHIINGNNSASNFIPQPPRVRFSDAGDNIHYIDSRFTKLSPYSDHSSDSDEEEVENESDDDHGMSPHGYNHQRSMNQTLSEDIESNTFYHSHLVQSYEHLNDSMDSIDNPFEQENEEPLSSNRMDVYDQEREYHRYMREEEAMRRLQQDHEISLMHPQEIRLQSFMQKRRDLQERESRYSSTIDSPMRFYPTTSPSNRISPIRGGNTSNMTTRDRPSLLQTLSDVVWGYDKRKSEIPLVSLNSNQTIPPSRSESPKQVQRLTQMNDIEAQISVSRSKYQEIDSHEAIGSRINANNRLYRQAQDDLMHRKLYNQMVGKNPSKAESRRLHPVKSSLIGQKETQPSKNFKSKTGISRPQSMRKYPILQTDGTVHTTGPDYHRISRRINKENNSMVMNLATSKPNGEIKSPNELRRRGRNDIPSGPLIQTTHSPSYSDSKHGKIYVVSPTRSKGADSVQGLEAARYSQSPSHTSPFGANISPASNNMSKIIEKREIKYYENPSPISNPFEYLQRSHSPSPMQKMTKQT